MSVARSVTEVSFERPEEQHQASVMSEPQATPSFSKTSLTTEMTTQAEKMEAWREFFAGLFDVAVPSTGAKDFNASAQAYRVGDTVLGRYSHTLGGIKRHQKSLKLERKDIFVLRLPVDGATKGQLGGQGFQMRPDRFTLFDFHQDYHVVEDDADFYSFTMPYSAIGFDPTRHPSMLQLHLDTPIGRILRMNFQLMLETMETASRQENLAVSDGFVGLLKGLVSGDFRDQTVFARSVRAREYAVRRFIDENLADPNLDASAICKAIGVSRAVLYRMFAEEGGVNRYITQKRLDGALRELGQTPPERGAISRVAQRWAFFDQAHFAKLFRSTFGFTASDALGSAIGNEAQLLGARLTRDGTGAGSTPLRDLYK